MIVKEVLDADIRRLRRDYLHASHEVALELLLICHRLQRLRFRLFGSCLPHSDGYFYIYDAGRGSWTKWQSVSIAEAA